MHVRNQTSQASVTSSRPLRDCSCQFVHRRQNVRSVDARQIKAFESTLLTILTHRFQIFLLQLMIVDTRCGNFTQLLDVFGLSTRSTVRLIFAHVLSRRRTTLSLARFLFKNLVTFLLVLRKFGIRIRFCIRRRDFGSACIHAECIPNIRDQGTALLSPDHACSSNVSTLTPNCVSFLPS